MQHKNKKKVLVTLRKAKSHLQKIIDMVENDAYCIDIIQQINAIYGYLESAKQGKLEDHMYHCIANNINKDEKTKKKYISEILQIFNMSKKR